MAHKVILPPQKNYIPQFLKQRDIISYYCTYGTQPSTGGLTETKYVLYKESFQE